MKVLLIEDDKRIASSVKRGLEGEGFTVDVALDGPNGLWMATEGSYDVIVLDIMLPGRNGYLVCSDLREAGDWTPILMLTAKDTETEIEDEESYYEVEVTLDDGSQIDVQLDEQFNVVGTD